MNLAELQPLARLDVAVGQPIPFPVFDRDGRLLLSAGQLVTDEDHRNALLDSGFYNNPRWQGVAPWWSFRSRPGGDDDGQAAESHSLPQRMPKTVAGHRLLRMWSLGGSPQDGMTVKLIGEHEGRSLILSAPERDGKYVFVKEGVHYAFRGF
jgi:hypothetical protein